MQSPTARPGLTVGLLGPCNVSPLVGTLDPERKQLVQNYKANLYSHAGLLLLRGN